MADQNPLVPLSVAYAFLLYGGDVTIRSMELLSRRCRVFMQSSLKIIFVSISFTINLTIRLFYFVSTLFGGVSSDIPVGSPYSSFAARRG